MVNDLQIAHPLVGSPPLPVAPSVLAAVTVALVALVVTRVRSAAPPAAPASPPAAPAAPPPASPGAAPATPGPAPRWHAATRAASAALLLVLVAVARGGPSAEPANLAAVATLNLLWPLLLAAAALLGPSLWRATDPWRALASAERLLSADPPARGPTAVWPAAFAAALWGVFLVEYAVRLDPRALATALAAYTLALVAGSLAVGRDRWLGSADAVGLVATWTGRLRRGGLRTWVPPAGAAALLGAAFGGVAFARVRLTSAWGRVALSRDAVVWTRAAAVAAVLLGASLAVLASRWAARRAAPPPGAAPTPSGARGSVEAGLVPLVAALAVAAVLRRAMVAAQLVPSLATDPFARGWRLLGPLGDTRAVDVNPWGTAVQQALAWAVVTVGAVAGAWVVARRVRGVRNRDPAAYALYVASGLAALAVTLR